MKLKELLSKLTYEIVQGTEEIEVGKVTNSTKAVEHGDVFVCIKGYVTDGHLFVEEAIKKGAKVLVVEQEISKTYSVTVVKVEDTRCALAWMSAAYFQYPSEKLFVIGVTGTKGKSSTVSMIQSVLRAAGRKAGMIGTIQVDTGARILHPGNTTPESCQIQECLGEMVSAGCDTVVMEVSSQGLKLKRTEGIIFDIAVFTNLGRDHVGPGEHPDFQDYLDSKKLLFGQCIKGIGNCDDIFWKYMVKEYQLETVTYGKCPHADVRIRDIQNIYTPGHMGIRCKMSGQTDMDVTLAIPGECNIYNAAAAACVCLTMGICGAAIEKGLLNVTIRGRMEQISGLQDASVFIDYAHNAMSLESILQTLRDCGSKRLVVVFGCGGNRSRERRYEMGETAGKLADCTIITTDNPRYENPDAIIDDIVEGMRRTKGLYKVIHDRKEAIAYAIQNRREGDVIVIAGKGHETYQEIKGVRYHMDDRELVLNEITKA